MDPIKFRTLGGRKAFTNPPTEKTKMKKNVLLVEDDPALRMVVREVLKDDFNIDEADNGETGVEKGVNGPADLVILDYHLPKRDGLEVIAEIKKVHPSVPVIVLTGYLSPESEKQFNELGAAKIFPKPFNYRTLLDAVKTLSGNDQEIAQDAVSVSSSPKGEIAPVNHISDNQALEQSLTTLAALSEKVEFMQATTEKYWMEPGDLNAIRETVRLMEAEIRTYYGKMNEALMALPNPIASTLLSGTKPCVLSDN